jgi:hypothetical protein
LCHQQLGFEELSEFDTAGFGMTSRKKYQLSVIPMALVSVYLMTVIPIWGALAFQVIGASIAFCIFQYEDVRSLLRRNPPDEPL